VGSSPAYSAWIGPSHNVILKYLIGSNVSSAHANSSFLQEKYFENRNPII